MRKAHRQLDRSIGEIRDILELEPTVDDDHLAQIAASIDNLAIHLEHDIRSAISARPASYAAQFRTQVTDAATQFRSAARQLNTMLVSGDRSNPDARGGQPSVAALE